LKKDVWRVRFYISCATWNEWRRWNDSMNF